jgi:hypothetical protein
MRLISKAYHSLILWLFPWQCYSQRLEYSGYQFSCLKGDATRELQYDAESGHTYYWRYTKATFREALKSVGNIAASSDPNFNWRDASHVVAIMRDMEQVEDGCDDRPR